MPHLKVKPFNLSSIDKLIEKKDMLTFRAKSQRDSDELLGLYFDNESFILQIKKREDEYLLKPDIIGRPLDVNKIKRALDLLALKLNLKILHSNTALSPTRAALAEPYHKRIKDFENHQFTRENIAVEVGFGSGRHLLYQARNNPDTLFIGIEIHTPSAQQVLKQIALQKIDNIWIVNYDARLLLEMMPSNSCTHIYVHFPVPWDKKPHRRVISSSFLKESLRVLGKDSMLELRTDSQKYYAYALEVFSEPKKIDFSVSKNSDIAVTSKYEDRWRAQDKDIYTLTVYSQEDSEAKRMEYSFSFEREKLKSMNMVQFSSAAQVEDGFFVHYEERFVMSDNKSMLVRVSFGSFDRPEHKYLMFYEGALSYYPQNPVRTETNYRAHKKIEELVYG